MTVPIYVINLDRSPDRLAAMTAQLSKLGLQFERISAIDGRTLQPNVIDALRVTVAGWKPLVPGEVGCFLSHRACWRRIADGGSDFGCILEDDVVLSSRLPLFIDSSQWIPADAEIIKLETTGVRIWIDRKSLSLGNDFSLQRLWSVHYGAGGYIVSRATAARLLDLTQRISIPVDDRPRLWHRADHRDLPALAIAMRSNAQRQHHWPRSRPVSPRGRPGAAVSPLRPGRPQARAQGSLPPTADSRVRRPLG